MSYPSWLKRIDVQDVTVHTLNLHVPKTIGATRTFVTGFLLFPSGMSIIECTKLRPDSTLTVRGGEFPGDADLRIGVTKNIEVFYLLKGL